LEPTDYPTRIPSLLPTLSPTHLPYPLPTASPTEPPTLKPSHDPTQPPTEAPTIGPTPFPSSVPTEAPTLVPTVGPTPFPSPVPTLEPSLRPTASPSLDPSSYPTKTPSLEPSFYPTRTPTLEPSFFPTAAPTHLVCWDICPPTLANISSEIIWVSGAILNEIDNIVDSLKPRFYLSETVEAKAAKLSSSNSFAPVVPSKSKSTPLLERFSEALQNEVASVTEPLAEASATFLDTYNAKLDALLEASTGTQKLTLKAGGRATLLASEPTEEVVERDAVGFGGWASSLVTMGAVVCGVLLEARRSSSSFSSTQPHSQYRTSHRE